MSRKRSEVESNSGVADHASENDAFTTSDEAPAVSNGNGGIVEVVVKPKKRKRNPDAPRPMYFLLAVSRSTSLARIIGEAPTIGQARKQSKNAAYSVRDGEDGPFIARAKLVV